MPIFKVSDELDAIGYDFTPYGPAGVIEEPTYNQIREFRLAMAESYDLLRERTPENLTEESHPTLADRLEFMSETLASDDSKEREVILRAISGVTGIDYNVLQALPYRAQQFFMGYVTRAFLRNVNNDTTG